MYFGDNCHCIVPPNSLCIILVKVSLLLRSLNYGKYHNFYGLSSFSNIIRYSYCSFWWWRLLILQVSLVDGNVSDKNVLLFVIFCSLLGNLCGHLADDFAPFAEVGVGKLTQFLSSSPIGHFLAAMA